MSCVGQSIGSVSLAIRQFLRAPAECSIVLWPVGRTVLNARKVKTGAPLRSTLLYGRLVMSNGTAYNIYAKPVHKVRLIGIARLLLHNLAPLHDILYTSLQHFTHIVPKARNHKTSTLLCNTCS
jgi:hypothetical protein